MPRLLPSLAPDDAAADRFAAAMRPFSPAPLSREEAREGLGNLLDFIALLERWDAEDRREVAVGPGFGTSLAPAREDSP